jgi:hypothetical protein
VHQQQTFIKDDQPQDFFLNDYFRQQKPVLQNDGMINEQPEQKISFLSNENLINQDKYICNDYNIVEQQKNDNKVTFQNLMLSNFNSINLSLQNLKQNNYIISI